MSQAAARVMVENGVANGSIVSIASISGKVLYYTGSGYVSKPKNGFLPVCCVACAARKLWTGKLQCI